jgi:histone H3/H4
MEMTRDEASMPQQKTKRRPPAYTLIVHAIVKEWTGRCSRAALECLGEFAITLLNQQSMANRVAHPLMTEALNYELLDPVPASSAVPPASPGSPALPGSPASPALPASPASPVAPTMETGGDDDYESDDDDDDDDVDAQARTHADETVKAVRAVNAKRHYVPENFTWALDFEPRMTKLIVKRRVDEFLENFSRAQKKLAIYNLGYAIALVATAARKAANAAKRHTVRPEDLKPIIMTFLHAANMQRVVRGRRKTVKRSAPDAAPTSELHAVKRPRM